MLTILGNSDVSVIYEVAPFLGSLLIIIYVVGIFFVIMNLFYAIIVSTLSDAKIEEDAKQKKKWAVMSDRIHDTWKATQKWIRFWPLERSEMFRIECRFK